ncbi:DUF5081 family protein [Listeria booriae]|uniref:DUF5081 family protein n=1 Tax=Listeria booriae TaxID=1552123 RepID=UPI00162ABB96|nr:DUF5081 family protein [Listeria booriae]MBC2265065.1 DUF5081 family protein [Listeria booriae]
MNQLFSLEEMYLLANSFSRSSIFGLPAKSVLLVRDSSNMEFAYQALKNKGILNEQGEVTHAGAYAIRALEEYTRSEKYVQIQQVIFAFPKDTSELVFIVKIGKEEGYQLHRMSKVLVPQLLIKKLDLINREAMEDEELFLLKRQRIEQRQKLDNSLTQENLIDLRIFGVSNTLEHWIIFDVDEMLFTINTQTKEYYRASQYWLMKILFDTLEIPYKKEGVDRLAAR